MVDRGVLINLVHERVPLWNPQNKQYHSRDVRTKLWQEVGDELDIEGDVARRHWDLLRDIFRRKLKDIQERQGTSRPTSKWAYFDEMSFLADVMKPRTQPSTLSNFTPGSDLDASQEGKVSGDVSPAGADLSEEDDDDKDDEDDDEPERNLKTLSDGNLDDGLKRLERIRTPLREPSRCVMCNGTKTKRRKKSATRFLDPRQAYHSEEDPSPKRRRSSNRLGVLGFKSGSCEEVDDDMLFFRSLLPYMKKLQPLRKMKLRSTIMNAVVAAFEGAETGDEPWNRVVVQPEGLSTGAPPNQDAAAAGFLHAT